MNSPVAFFVFNRPDCTANVFAEIRRARPPILLLVADGPRPDRLGEAEDCAEVRRIIADGIDWPCRVLRNFSETNLGCRVRVSSGLNWVFENVDEAIILEDDCLPHPSFFGYCEELLERYRDDERIVAISGDNLLGDSFSPSGDSYIFSRYPLIWGWATWKRVWTHYDVEMRRWPAFRGEGYLAQIFSSSKLVAHWQRCFEQVYARGFDTWDYQFTFACWCLGGLSIVPSVNLVENVGFGDDATHTKGIKWSPDFDPKGITLPLQHPQFIVRHKQRDHLFENRTMFAPSIFARIKNRGWSIIRRISRFWGAR